MASRLVAAKLENIQSWQKDSQVIHFTPEVVNVIRAPSETGKSVFFKVFYQMVFPNYYKYKSRNDLIRKGCSSAQATYWLENGTIIKFFLEHSTQHFEMQKAGEKNMVYYNPAMPQEIIDEFGLVVDNNLKFILNIFTKDNQYPFVTTAKSWNASALNQVFCDQEVENALVNLKVWERELKDKMTAVKQVYLYRKRLAEDLVYTDIEEMKRNQLVVKEIAQQYSAIDDILTQLNNLAKAHATLEKYDYEFNNVVEINDIRKLMIAIDKILESLTPLERNLLFVDSLPENTIDMILLNQIKEYMIKLNQIFESLKVITCNQNIVESIPDITAKLQTIISVRDYLMHVLKVQQALQQLYSQDDSYAELEEKQCHMQKELESLLSYKKDIDTVEGYKEKLNTIYVESNKMFGQMNNYFKLHQASMELNQELDKLKAELKICPTCNRPFEESVGENNGQ